MEQIDDLLLDHQVPSIRTQATPILFVHRMWGGSRCFADYRRIAKRYGAEYLEVEGHGHMFLLEDGWEAPLEGVLAWARRATS
ncbi:MAG: hypothetical protein HY217_03460 [Candidatus Rokubacteria bacterium]|nr:hypothetical protein [Candidatus Rokubacteria bacterium]